VNSGKLSFDSVKSQYQSEPLDWITPATLNAKFASSMKNAKPGQAIGPAEINGFEQLLLYEQNRRGSEDGFQKAKDALMMQAQAQDFERRLDFWVERKKSDMHIVVNKL